MSKTLVVSYCPRSGSNTKKLVDHFTKLAEGKTEIEVLELAKNPVPMFLEKEINAYVKRNFGGQELTSDEIEILKPIDELCNQVLNADYVVLAYPIYNFTFPGPVKCWFDAIIQSGKTFKYENGGFVGMLTGKKALVITTSGGDYSSNAAWDFSTPLAHGEFGFIGMESKVITAGGMSMSPEMTESSLNSAMQKIDTTVSEWYH
jgi:FMN-dependent NADH-azoreductase